MNDWDDLRYFLAVAQAGNVTAASITLAVNHSTVSRRITAMEKKHGVRLFERISTGYVMTEAAESIYAYALEIESQNKKVERLLFAGDTRLSGKLRMTLPHDLANHCIIPHLPRFTEAYPEIDLELIVSPNLKDLNAREADIAVRLTPAPPEYLIGKKVAELCHGVYASSDYNQREKEQHSLILWNDESHFPDWASSYFPDANVVLRVDDLASMYAAVKAGLGLARMPCFLADKLAEKSVERLKLELAPSHWGIWVLNHVDLRETARVHALKQFLITTLQQQKNLIEGEQSQFRLHPHH
ncbi:MAG: LysR family transcriptional regulator [Pseudomonadales bacterium]|nr:LysR family transcriptional regulator [Pseudomonadales bacterium]